MTARHGIASANGALRPVASLQLRDGATVTLSRIVAPLAAGHALAVASAIVGMDPWRRYGFPPERLTSFLSPSDETTPRYLMCSGEDVAGLMAVKRNWMFGSYLKILAVLPAYQGRGIGSAALDWLEATARANGDRNQFVVTSAFNSGGLKLYTRHGFTPIAEMPGLIADGETEILLRKRLA